MRAALSTLAFALLAVTITRDASAEDAPAPAAREDETVLAARREFTEGTALVRAERWGEALAAFERAAKLKSHAITTYNIAQCERAMSQYTRARAALLLASKQNAESGNLALSESVAEDVRAQLGELDRLLPRVTLTLDPPDGAIAVDGRPIERADDDAGEGKAPPVFVTGTMPPGRGTPPGVKTLVLVTNPGAHVITVSRQGYADVVVNRTFSPSTSTTLSLELDKLPATIHVSSNLRDAVVRVNDADVGNAPVDVSRTAGRYRVLVSRRGFVPYEAEVTVRSGERVELTARLGEERPALTQRWWFWAGVGVVVAGAATATYFAARSDPEPQRPPTDGGGLGWSLRLP